MRPYLKIDAVLIKVLKQLRLEANLKQIDLASLLGSPQSFVSKYESGERILSFSETWIIVHTLGSSPEEVVKLIKIELSGKSNEAKS